MWWKASIVGGRRGEGERETDRQTDRQRGSENERRETNILRPP